MQVNVMNVVVRILCRGYVQCMLEKKDKVLVCADSVNISEEAGKAYMLKLSLHLN